MKKFLALMLTVLMLLSVCSAMAVAESTLPTFDQIVLGENTDLTAKIHFVYHRTDIPDKLDGYVKEFQKIYPNVEIEYELITDYAENSLLRVGNTDWTIMGIPTVEKDELPNYFVPLGDLATLENEYNFMSSWSVNGVCYGIPSTAAAQGVLYNKAVFEAAGITELPKTPDEFIAALKAVKEKTDAIPLYTNYAAGWTMGAWDAYIGVAATGKASYMNQDLLHAENPFADRGDGTGPYAVYKILLGRLQGHDEPWRDRHHGAGQLGLHPDAAGRRQARGHRLHGVPDYRGRQAVCARRRRLQFRHQRPGFR